MFNALLIASNGTDSRVGSLTADWERFFEWKRIEREDEPRRVLVLNWRQKSSARSQIKLAIEDMLDTGLPKTYDKPLFEKKCAALFEHVFESYGS